MQITVTSVLVDDQAKAHRFYTEVLGFETRRDIPLGEYRWLTVGTAGGAVELLLEPNARPAAKTYQAALYKDGIPATTFRSENLAEEYDALVARGVKFRGPPQDAGPVRIAVFDDTCGNWLQLHEEKR